MMDAIHVPISLAELARINENAQRRNQQKEDRGIRTKKISSRQTDLELHRIEVMSQYAVSKYLEEPMDWSIRLGGNKAGAHFYAGGFSMRVQTATHYPPILKFNRADDFTTDLTALCMINWPTLVSIYGCISRERFLRECITKNFGYGNRLIIPSRSLTPITEFEAEAERGLRKAAGSAASVAPDEAGSGAA